MHRFIVTGVFLAVAILACGKKSNQTPLPTLPNTPAQSSGDVPPNAKPGWTADLIKSSFSCSAEKWCECYINNIALNFTPDEFSQLKKDEAAGVGNDNIRVARSISDTCIKLTQ